MGEKTPRVEEASRLTDAGNAKRFALEHGEDLRYVHAWQQWLRWDGKRFVRDDVGNVTERAKQTIRGMFVDAEQLPEADRVRLFKHALKSEHANRIEAMIKLARSEPGIPVTPEQFDAHPWLFNANNCVVDLRTGELWPHNRDYLLTNISPIDYLLGPEGDCPVWELSLDKILGGDDELTCYVQKSLVRHWLVGFRARLADPARRRIER